jgi:hypothetical protein
VFHAATERSSSHQSISGIGNMLDFWAVSQTHGFFIRGSVSGGESISSHASAVINQTAVLFTIPVA